MSRRRKAFASATAVFTALGTAMIGLQAHALESVGTGPGVQVLHVNIDSTYSHSSWLGAYTFDSGQFGWCLEPLKNAPTHSQYTTLTQVTSYTNAQGVALSPTQLAQLSYVMAKYGGSGISDNEAAAVSAAVVHLVGLNNVPLNVGGTVTGSYQLDDPTSFGSKLIDLVSLTARAEALAIVADAKSNYNQWDGSGQLNTNAASITRPGQTIEADVTFPGIGAGKSVRFTIDYPDGRTAVRTVTTDANGVARLSFTLDPTLRGAYELNAEITGIPDRYPALASPNAATDQTILLGGAGTRSWATDVPVVFDITGYSPQVTTSTGTQIISGTTALTDTVFVSGGVAGLGFSGTSTLYGPFATETAALGADVTAHTPVGVATFSGVYGADGRATVTSSAVTVSTGVGYYFWYEQLDADPTNDGNSAVQDPKKRAPEVTLKFSPTVTSQVSKTLASHTETIDDVVYLSGLVPSVGGTPISYELTGAAYGPVAAVDGSCQTITAVQYRAAGTLATVSQAINAAQIAADGTATLTGLGAYTPSWTTHSCVSYGYELVATAADGSEVRVIHAPGDPTQTTLSVGLPSLATQVSDQTVDPGATITDTVIMTGLLVNPNVTYTVTGGLYGPLAPNASGGCLGLDWTNAPKAADINYVLQPTDIVSGAATLTGIGSYTVPADAQAGCYSYGEVLTVSFTPPGTPDIVVEHPPGHVTQTTIVNVPPPPPGTPDDEYSVPPNPGLPTTGRSTRSANSLGAIGFGLLGLGLLSATLTWAAGRSDAGYVARRRAGDGERVA